MPPDRRAMAERIDGVVVTRLRTSQLVKVVPVKTVADQARGSPGGVLCLTDDNGWDARDRKRREQVGLVRLFAEEDFAFGAAHRCPAVGSLPAV